MKKPLLISFYEANNNLATKVKDNTKKVKNCRPISLVSIDAKFS